VLDSMPVRIAEDPDMMPRLSQTMGRWASGVLWASMQTSTQQGVFGLATGRATTSFDQLRMFGGSGYRGFTIFDDIRARRETVCFSGERSWTTFFGHLGTHNHPTHGEGQSFFADDMAALQHADSELSSASPPTLTVIHITETDFAAHQFG